MPRTIVLADGRTLEWDSFGHPDGRPVLFFHGTPGTCAIGAVADAAARAHGLRLVATTRPGYGETTMVPPGLACVARDVVELADALDLGSFVSHGISGGGPYAVALAAVAPDRVEGVLVSGGIGRDVEVTPEVLDDAERAVLDLAADGDVAGALKRGLSSARAEWGELLDLDVDAFGEAFIARLSPGAGVLAERPELPRVLLADVWRALRTVEGYVRDNLSWGLPWDIDLQAVTAPTLLVHGGRDVMVPAAHGDWLADRIPRAHRVVLPEADHGQVTLVGLDDQYRQLLTLIP